MLTSVLSSLCVSIVAASPETQESLPQSLKKWPHVQTGTTIHYRTKSSISQEVSYGKRKVERVLEVHTEETHSIKEVGADGSFVLSITRTRVWGTVHGGSVKTPASFDTAKGGRIHPLAKSVVAMLLPVSHVQVDRLSKVLSVRKARKDGKLGEPDDHARDTTQFNFVHAPLMPVPVGASWRPAEGVHECGAAGCVELVTRNKLSKMDNDSFSVVTVAVDDHAEGAEAQHRVERTVSLSRRDGLLLEMRASGTSRSPVTKRKVRIEMKRVLKKPKSKTPKRVSPNKR